MFPNEIFLEIFKYCSNTSLRKFTLVNKYCKKLIKMKLKKRYKQIFKPKLFIVLRYDEERLFNNKYEKMTSSDYRFVNFTRKKIEKICQESLKKYIENKKKTDIKFKDDFGKNFEYEIDEEFVGYGEFPGYNDEYYIIKITKEVRKFIGVVLKYNSHIDLSEINRKYDIIDDYTEILNFNEMELGENLFE